MPAVTVADLITRIKDNCQLDNDKWTGEATLLRWLNAARPRLDAIIARSGWVVTPGNFAIVADGSNTYDTLVQTMAIMGVFEVDNGIYRPLKSSTVVHNPTERQGQALEYFAEENTATGSTRVGLRPVPQTGTYYVFYLAQPLTLVTGTPGAGQASSVNYPMGWEEWLVLEVTRQVFGREESENATAERRIREIERAIEREANDRLFAQGLRVRDTRQLLDQWTVTSALDPSDWLWP